MGGALRAALAALVVAGGCVAASAGDQEAIGRWGLIQALPWPFFAALVLLTALFFLELFRASGRSRVVLVTCLAGLVLLLHGAPAFLEQYPRFPTAYLHAGFAGQILDHGTTRPDVDARFSWPGFFSAAAAVSGAAGVAPVELIRWAPVVLVLLYLVPVHAIGLQTTGSETATWLGMFLFVPVNWVGQDYFAPQTVGFLLYLCSVALVVALFRERLAPRSGHRREGRPLDGRPDVPLPTSQRLAVIGLLLALAAALSVSHQLSPIMLCAGLLVLVLVRRNRLLSLPVVAGIMALAWISVGATGYWVGHLDDILGPLGDVGSSVGAVDARTTGSPAHHTITVARVAYTLAVWGCAGVAGLLLWIRRRPPLTLLALTAAPGAAIVQSYGGEGVLRIFLFSSAFASLLIAQGLTTFVPRATARPALRRTLLGAAAVVTACVLPVFVLLRYGNESYERVRPADLAASRWVHEVAPEGSNIITPTAFVPVRYEEATEYYYARPTDQEGFLEGDPEAVLHPIDSDRLDAPATYLVMTPTQRVYVEEVYGLPDTWFETEVRPLLSPENGYHLVYDRDGALVYQFERSS